MVTEAETKDSSNNRGELPTVLKSVHKDKEFRTSPKGIEQVRTIGTKRWLRKCKKESCDKSAIGKTGFCIAHGGGKRCKKEGCDKSARGNTGFCVAHGGGKRCKKEGCDKSAQGNTGFCIVHGGGKRCKKEGCDKSAQGKTGFCVAHGGGKRCKKEGCDKSAIGKTGFCVAHGGGKRCKKEGCDKSAIGKTGFCVVHGGGKRCKKEGCDKSAQGKTGFCIAHGGGERCKKEGCDKSARGKTGFCKAHGGGKRCKKESCDKSAQGNTGFCIVHGGGKRCINCIHWIDSQCANPKYDDYCARCFMRVFPDDPRSKRIPSRSKELKVRDMINENFEGFIHDQIYTSHCDCTHRRRIDHRKIIGNTLLAIETDEFAHRNYDSKDEDNRYNDIQMVHGGKCIWIRFNPDDNRDKTPFPKKLLRLKEEIEYQIDSIESNTNVEISQIVRLFY